MLDEQVLLQAEIDGLRVELRECRRQRDDLQRERGDWVTAYYRVLGSYKELARLIDGLNGKGKSNGAAL